MTDDATYLAHLAIVAAFTLVALLAIAMLAYELIRDILPDTKGHCPYCCDDSAEPMALLRNKGDE